MAQKKLPSVILRAGEDRRVRAGHPWVFSNEILMDADAKAIPPGSLATLLWRRIVHHHEHEVSLVRFTLLGLATVPAALVASTAALWLSLELFGT